MSRTGAHGTPARFSCSASDTTSKFASACSSKTFNSARCVQRLALLANRSSCATFPIPITIVPGNMGLDDVQALDADFYLLSLYKVYGPHMAALWGRRDAIGELNGPNHFFVPADEVPYKFELGGASQHLERRLRSQPAHALCEFDHFPVPRCRCLFGLIYAPPGRPAKGFGHQLSPPGAAQLKKILGILASVTRGTAVPRPAG